MDLEIIKTVLSVARLKSFSAAAFAVPCSQSSVSRRVEAAEDELGVKIFSRPAAGGTREVTLTPVGEEIVRAMIKIVDAYTELFRAADLSASGGAILNLGIRRNMMAPMGVSLMKADFFEKYPEISIAARHDKFDVLLSEFRMRRLDAVLFSCAGLDLSYFRTKGDEKVALLGKTCFSVGVSAHSPLSEQSSVRLEDLRNEVFLLNSDPDDAVDGVLFSSQRRFRSVCLAAGFDPHIYTIPNNMLEIRYKMATEGKGVVPSHTPKAWRSLAGLAYVPVEGSDFLANYYMLYVAGRKEKEVAAFREFFSAHLDA